MIPATTMLALEIDMQDIRKIATQQIEKEISEVIWLVDVNRLIELTSMSRRTLEQEILCHPSMRAIEIKRMRKRWYPADKAKQVILEIVSGW